MTKPRQYRDGALTGPWLAILESTQSCKVWLHVQYSHTLRILRCRLYVWRHRARSLGCLQWGKPDFPQNLFLASAAALKTVLLTLTCPHSTSSEDLHTSMAAQRSNSYTALLELMVCMLI